MNSHSTDSRDLLNGLIEAADTLARIERGLQQTWNSVTATPTSWWRRWFRRSNGSSPSTAAALESSLEGLRLGLQRLHRTLEQQGLCAVPALGQPFDAETMQVIEAIEGTGQPHGTVIEEVRRGYLRDGAVLRFAQVKVAK